MLSNHWRDLDSIIYDTHSSGVVVERNKSSSGISSALLVNYDIVLASMNMVCSLRPKCCLEDLGYTGLRWGHPCQQHGEAGKSFKLRMMRNRG